MCRYQTISAHLLDITHFDLSNLSLKMKIKMPLILIQLQNLVPKSNSAKMISFDIAPVQK